MTQNETALFYDPASDGRRQVQMYRKSANALNYVSECYQGTSTSNSEACNKLHLSRLPYTVNRAADCPYAPEMCRVKSNNTFFDSGYVDSHLHLGMNTGPSLQIRMQQHCAPLVTKGYYTVIPSGQNSSTGAARYHYGNYTDDTGKVVSDYIAQIEYSTGLPSFELSGFASDYHVR